MWLRKIMTHKTKVRAKITAIATSLQFRGKKKGTIQPQKLLKRGKALRAFTVYNVKKRLQDKRLWAPRRRGDEWRMRQSDEMMRSAKERFGKGKSHGVL